MVPGKYLLLFLLMLGILSSATVAEGAGLIGIEEINVTALRSEKRALQPALVLTKSHFERTVPTSFTEIFRVVIGVGIRTNSRGEAVLRLRGSEERQSQIFIDGAPISVPWDGRADLSLFPASLVRNVSVIKSAAPIEYGANAVLGVIDISTQETGDELQVSVRNEIGSQGAFLLEGEAYIPLDSISLQLGVNHRSRDAISVADDAAIPFDPLEGDGRTNTDMESTSLFAAATLEQDWGSIRLSGMDISAKKGIAAAAHIDPAKGGVRFWRYPDWNMTQINAAGDIDLSDTANLRVNAWHQRFSQSIVSYSDVSYSLAEDQQNDRDKTYGSRLVLSNDWSHVTTRLVASLQDSTHHQIETNLIANVSGDSEQFRQKLVSIGGEIDVPITNNLKSSFALAHDRASTPLTGGRPGQPSISRWAGNVALAWQASPEWTITSTLGKRTRFPTMRELYGTALGKFLVNPGLQPESAIVGDITFDWAPPEVPITVSVTPWFTRINDTLSRRQVVVDNTTLRQRFNLDGSFGYGIEATAIWQLSDSFTLEANTFWQKLRADRDKNSNRPTLYQRPKSQALLAGNFKFTNGSNLRLEVNYTGPAYDENEGGSTVKLRASTELNVKFYVPLKRTKLGEWQLYSTLDNLTNALVLPQLGLPSEGRTFKVGLRLTGS
ncbi:MAG: TonB-dependent receptor [Kordiimonadaceae bacterium]|nr:TonB-dependent receptor [Kordiimonadaceae bacterium]